MRTFAIFIFYFWDLFSFLILKSGKIRYSTEKKLSSQQHKNVSTEFRET